ACVAPATDTPQRTTLLIIRIPRHPVAPLFPYTTLFRSCSLRTNKKQSRFAQNYCERLECSRDRRYGSGTLPLPVSVLCCRWKIELPTLSAQCRYLFGRALQHCFLRFTYFNDGSGMRIEVR